MRCSRCHSDDTSTFEMAYLRGSQSGTISGTVYEFDTTVEWCSANVQLQSHLAKITAPPTQPSFWSVLTWLGFLVTVFLTIVTFLSLQYFLHAHPDVATMSPLGKDPIKHMDYFHLADAPCLFAPAVFIFGLIIAAKLRNPSYKREAENYQHQLSVWQSSVICLRCGNNWLL